MNLFARTAKYCRIDVLPTELLHFPKIYSAILYSFRKSNQITKIIERSNYKIFELLLTRRASKPFVYFVNFLLIFKWIEFLPAIGRG